MNHFATINGINGASGLIYENGRLLLISDDSFVLYIYSLENKNLKKINLSENQNQEEGIIKSLKSDFESIATKDNEIHIFGSGSAENRYQHLIIDSDTLKVKKRKSLKKLYHQMMDSSGITEDDFNIEGVILGENKTLFFNRGNGPEKKNGIFKIGQKTEFIPVELPVTNNVRFGFTDACCFENQIYFTASAEAGDSTYDDGEVLGSAIGIINTEDLSLKEFKIITNKHKIEGISVIKKTEDFIEFILCEDADDDKNETNIFKYTLKN